MPTRPGQSKALIEQLLASQDPVATEAAIARLAIIGRPALRQVVQRLADAPPEHLPRLLRVVERIGDPGALPTLQALLGHDTEDVAIAAVDALGAVLDSPDAVAAAAALDALTAAALDRAGADAIRLRAFDVIATAPVRSAAYDADIVAPLRRQLRKDPSAAIREGVSDAPVAAPTDAVGPDGDDRLDAIAAGDLPADPERLRQLLGTQGQAAPLTVLHRLIERIRAREATIEGEGLEQWRVARATAHLALAARGSRLAVYDLRETLEALGGQTPVGMLSALQQVGDASVLDVVADAHAAAPDTWFRGQLAAIFRAIVEREKLTRRQATMKKLAARLPDTIGALWG